MKKERLLRLASLLEVDAHHPKGVKFDLATWGEATDRDNIHSCGTTACAMGLAAISGIFAEEGLRHTNNDFIRIVLVEDGGEYWNWDAPAKLFGINIRTAQWLFSKMAYRGETTHKQGELNVAKRIRNFVAGKLKPSKAYSKPY